MSSGRRRFITQAATVAAATTTTIGAAPQVIAQPKFRWRMSTAFGPALDWAPGRGRAPDLKKLAGEVVQEESQQTPMARKVHASYTKFQTLVGPWDHVAEGAYQQLVAG